MPKNGCKIKVHTILVCTLYWIKYGNGNTTFNMTTLSITTRYIILLRTALCSDFGHYAGGHYAECRYAECCYTDCHYAECHYNKCHFAVRCHIDCH